MKINIKSDAHCLNAELGHFARCCAGFELGAQRGQIESVELRLSKLHETRDGKDKSCRVQIDLRAREQVIVQVLDADFHVAIFLALERASWSVASRQQPEPGKVGKLPIVEQQQLTREREPDRAA